MRLNDDFSTNIWPHLVYAILWSMMVCLLGFVLFGCARKGDIRYEETSVCSKTERQQYWQYIYTGKTTVPVRQTRTKCVEYKDIRCHVQKYDGNEWIDIEVVDKKCNDIKLPEKRAE